jgi:hypothetical protein
MVDNKIGIVVLLFGYDCDIPLLQHIYLFMFETQIP